MLKKGRKSSACVAMTWKIQRTFCCAKISAQCISWCIRRNGWIFLQSGRSPRLPTLFRSSNITSIHNLLFVTILRVRGRSKPLPEYESPMAVSSASHTINVHSLITEILHFHQANATAMPLQDVNRFSVFRYHHGSIHTNHLSSFTLWSHSSHTPR